MANEITSSVSVIRATIATALATGILFVACWIGVAVHVVASHMFLSLFTIQPIETAAALGDGLLWSIVFGALFGLLASLIYNTVPLGRG